MGNSFECIYCGRTTQPSNEHILPQSIGCTLELQNAVCVPCNNGFSRDFEQRVARQLAYFRARWVNPRLDRRDWTFPAEVVSGNVPKGRKVRIKRDGTLSPLKPFRLDRAVKEDGSVEEAYRAMTQDDEAQLRERFLAKHPNGEWKPGVAVRGTVTVESDMGAEILWTPDGHRLAAKCAFNYLAWTLSPQVCLGSEFDRVRSFICTGGELDPSLCDIVCNPATEKASRTPIPMHSINLTCDNAIGRIRAVVVLFGVFHFLVTLTPRRKGICGWWYAHDFNPITGQSRDRELMKRIGLPVIVERRSASTDEMCRRAHSAMARALPRLIKATRAKPEPG